MLHNLFLYLPQNAICFIIVFFSVQIILSFFINHVLKFKHQPSHLKIIKISMDQEQSAL